jgi:hypothetical protein
VLSNVDMHHFLHLVIAKGTLFFGAQNRGKQGKIRKCTMEAVELLTWVVTSLRGSWVMGYVYISLGSILYSCRCDCV